MIKITLLYFAALAEKAQCEYEILEIHEQTTLNELFLTLKAHYGFEQAASDVRVAINDEFCDWQTPIQSQDTIAFIPPVAGG